MLVFCDFIYTFDPHKKRFNICLPIVVKMHQEETGRRGTQVLVIDPSPAIRKRIISSIKTIEELFVLEADSLEVAFHKIKHFQPLIILYDLEMHCSSLINFISKTRAERQNYFPIFIALSNKGDNVQSMQALEGGTSCIIKKDFSHIEFQRILSRILDKKEGLLRLSEQQSHCQSLFDLSSNPVFLAKKDSLQIVDANPAATSVYGYSRDEFINMSLCELVDDPLQVIESVCKRLVFENHVFHRKKNRRLFPAKASYRYFSKNGSDLFLMSVTDMSLSEKRTAERQALARIERRNMGGFGYHHFLAMLRGEKNERRRVAQEIHDHSGQLLVLAKLKTEGLMGQLAGQDVHSEIMQLRDDLVAAISSLRNLTGSLNNDLLPYTTLESSIDKLVKKIGSKIHVNYLVEPVEAELNSHEKLQMYRIAEEALHNAMKHSPGKYAELFLQQKKDKSIALRVFSRGVNCRGSMFNSGMGLRTMQQRGEFIGGKVLIEASMKGFTVELRLPANRRYKDESFSR